MLPPVVIVLLTNPDVGNKQASHAGVMCGAGHPRPGEQVSMVHEYNVEDKLNSDFDTLCDWFVDNKLSIHFGKGKTISLFLLVRRI